jgi:hypothetical protein
MGYGQGERVDKSISKMAWILGNMPAMHVLRTVHRSHTVQEILPPVRQRN